MSAVRTFGRARFGPPTAAQQSHGIPAAAYPGRVATNSDLIVAVDRQQTSLLLPMGVADTSMTVLDPSLIAAYNLLSIDNEIVKTTGPPAGNVVPVSRGFDGTAPAAHLATASVSGLVDAYHHNALVAEVEAIETFLGPNGSFLSTFVNGPWMFSQVTNFACQTPGGNLIVGSNVITLSPVPLGVNGSDVGHLLYITGGTGTAEAAPIIGGTAVAGAPSGTVIVTCAHTHSGAWQICSASAGIQEAAVALGGVGSIVMPKGTLNIYGRILLPTTISLAGQGSAATILSTASGATPCICIADGLGVAAGQGIGVHQNYQIAGGSTPSAGLWIGGDPAGVFAPAGQTGSYTRFYNLLVQGTGSFIPLHIQAGNFITFVNSSFSTANGPALRIPSGGGGQPMEFYGCLLSVVPPNPAVQMDSNEFLVGPVLFVGGQVSGYITGAQVGWESIGTHYEPNGGNTGIVNITNANTHRVTISGGMISCHGTALTNAISIAGPGNFVYLDVHDVCVVADGGMTVTNFISYGPAAAGLLSIRGVYILAAGLVTNLYSLTSPGNFNLQVAQGVNTSGALGVPAAAATAFPASALNYPRTQSIELTGPAVGGSGITAVSGLMNGQEGMIYADNTQTFTAGATVGNTITIAASAPHQFSFNNGKIWIS